jgi:hypothetical protein
MVCTSVRPDRFGDISRHAILYHTDDLHLHRVRRIIHDRELSADGIQAGPVFLRHRFVDDCDALRICFIGSEKIPPSTSGMSKVSKYPGDTALSPTKMASCPFGGS